MIKEIMGSALCITSMVSCATTVPATKEESKAIKIDGLYFHRFEMEGHKYIVFRESHNQISVVHDPDCVCLKKVEIKQ